MAVGRWHKRIPLPACRLEAYVPRIMAIAPDAQRRPSLSIVSVRGSLAGVSRPAPGPTRGRGTFFSGRAR